MTAKEIGTVLQILGGIAIFIGAIILVVFVLF